MNNKRKSSFRTLILLAFMVLTLALCGYVVKTQSTNNLKQGKKAVNNSVKKNTTNNKASNNAKTNVSSNSKANIDKKAAANNQAKKEEVKNPLVTIEMEDGAKIKVELYPKTAPNTVKNFISLVKKGFYNGLIFHRVIPGFMIQGGDPEGTGIGGPGYSIKGEFSANNFDNPLKHVRGVISMARTNEPDTAGSQFFIMVKDSPFLDGQYAAFGKVTEGMQEADKIVNAPRDGNDKPLKDEKMKKVTVDTFGINYGEPEIIK